MFCKSASFRNTSLKMSMWWLGRGGGAISVLPVSIPGRLRSVDSQWHGLVRQPRAECNQLCCWTCTQTHSDVGREIGTEGPAQLNSYAMFVSKLSEFKASWGY